MDDILTPRVDIEAVALEDSREEIAATFLETGYSRLPVYRDSIDHIVGILNEKDFFRSPAGGDFSVEPLMHQPLFVPPSLRISDALKLLHAQPRPIWPWCSTSMAGRWGS